MVPFCLMCVAQIEYSPSPGYVNVSVSVSSSFHSFCVPACRSFTRLQDLMCLVTSSTLYFLGYGLNHVETNILGHWVGEMKPHSLMSLEYGMVPVACGFHMFSPRPIASQPFHSGSMILS